MERLLFLIAILAFTGCSTLGSDPAVSSSPAGECSQAYFDGLRAELTKTEITLKSATAIAERDPTDKNWGKAAEAVADASGAAADLAAARADCSGPRRGGL